MAELGHRQAHQTSPATIASNRSNVKQMANTEIRIRQIWKRTTPMAAVAPIKATVMVLHRPM